MPSAAHLIAFAFTAVVVLLIPGPSVLFVVGRALADGRRVALFSVVGNSLGEYMQVIAVAFGIGALAEQSVAALTTIKLLGGIYLVYLGIRTYRRRGLMAASFTATAARHSHRRSFAEGFVVGATNPKTVVFLAAILPQFTRHGGNLSSQILVLGLVFMGLAILFDSGWALAAGSFRGWFASSPRRLELIGGTGGLAIAALGAGLVVTARRN